MKKFKIFVLPSTEKATFGDIVLDPKLKKLFIFRNQRCTEVKQHLYIADTQGSIEVGDWFIMDAECICKCSTSAQAKNCEGEENIYKIICSTDSSLGLPVIDNEHFLQAICSYEIDGIEDIKVEVNPHFNTCSISWKKKEESEDCEIQKPQVDFEELQNFINFIGNDMVKTLPVLHKDIDNFKLFFEYVKNPSFARKASKWFEENS